MRNTKKLLALLLALVMCFGLLAGCNNDTTGDNSQSPAPNNTNQPSNTNQPGNTNDPGNTNEPNAPVEIVGLSERKTVSVPAVTESNTVLVSSVEQGLEGKFSPFFYLSANDGSVVDMFTLYTLTSDRVANPVNDGIAGETRPYNGTDYTYTGCADVAIVENPDGYPAGYVAYDITLRDDIYFSDGVNATIDDVIFGMYVTLDPTYDGNHTLYSVPIEGLSAYRSNFAALLMEAGKDNTDFSQWTQADQELFWSEFETAGAAFAQEIVDYCVAAGYASADDDISKVAPLWGFSAPEGGTALDFFYVMFEEYGGDLKSLSDTESAGSSLFDLIPSWDKWSALPENAAQYITGIIKTGDYSMRVVTTELDATAIYHMSLEVAPLHWYGDLSQYDYNARKFGFPKGDLSVVKEKTTTPLGAGPFTFVSYDNGEVVMQANPLYYKGEPQLQYLKFKETTEAQKLSGLTTGTLDVADPSYKVSVAKDIAKANGFTDDEWENFDGPILTTKLIDYRGYGYIGIAANRVMVGDDPYSDASKNLRKAFATMFAAYREETVRSYYGTTASVINYPISNTSWAAPQVTDDDYQIAYSVDVNGNPIYTASMTTEERYAAALQAALGFFEAAGYTVEDGKVTAAPEGEYAKLEYAVEIGGNGSGDHPTFLLLKNVSEALKTIGITMQINDYADSSDLYATYQNNVAAMWCAAWQASSDPDMFQLYHSEGSTNYYQIKDADLDEAIMMARASTDQAYRKGLYKGAMEIIMDNAVEVPIYQRSDANVFSTERVEISTLPTDMTPFWGWASDIQTVAVK